MTLWNSKVLLAVLCIQSVFYDDLVAQEDGVFANDLASKLKLERSIQENCGEFSQSYPVAGLKPKNLDSYNKYLQASENFDQCVNRQKSIIETELRLENILPSSFQTTSNIYSKSWKDLNQALVWKPAPEKDQYSGDYLHPSIRAGDQARAVFGRIPVMSCEAPNTTTLRTQVDGNQIQLLPNPENEYINQFAHINSSGKIVKWTDTVEQCDKPSIAGGVTECGTGSRIVYETNDNVTWLMLCRKSLGENQYLDVGEPREDFDLNTNTDNFDSIANGRYGDYWAENNPFYSLIGLIGHNRETGETVFFDGQQKDWNSYRFDEPVFPPGGFGYADRNFRAKEIAGPETETLFSNEFEVKCHACHDNKNPWILAPHTTFEEVGFRSTIRKKRFSTRKISDFSYWSSDPNLPFRIIGSEYVRRIDPLSKREEQDAESKGYEYLSSARSFSINGCHACHTLTTQMTGRYFSYDALGLVNPKQPPSHIYPSEEGEWEKQWEFINKARTNWGAKIGKIKEWMPIRFGILPATDHIEPTSKEILATILNIDTEEDPNWYPVELEKISKKLDKCANADPDDIIANAEECGYKNLYTECVIPEVDPGNLEFTFSNDTVEVERVSVGQELSWEYLNNLGGVKDRDDVRFEARLTRVPLVNDAVPTTESFPEISAYDISGSAAPLVVRDPLAKNEEFHAALSDISPANQPVYTDPFPSELPRQYVVQMPPLQCGFRYLATVKARRFCFDGGEDRLSSKQGVTYIDVKCSAG